MDDETSGAEALRTLKSSELSVFKNFTSSVPHHGLLEALMKLILAEKLTTRGYACSWTDIEIVPVAGEKQSVRRLARKGGPKWFHPWNESRLYVLLPVRIEYSPSPEDHRDIMRLARTLSEKLVKTIMEIAPKPRSLEITRPYVHALGEDTYFAGGTIVI